ncbi:hypothetical protein [Pseudoclavibacter helvolus]|uniref:variant leucine-rich repeat-containing protein n=1 Tax=Pseudoclavibacter helvolus TaxID=255205 RepID=UPI0024ACD9A0|nr:hypothetical protein [Pseudoclavibacter helvolus]
MNPGDDIDARLLANPHLPAEELARIAAARPDLHRAVAAHPNVYPGLADWIDSAAASPTAPQQSYVQRIIATPNGDGPAATPQPVGRTRKRLATRTKIIAATTIGAVVIAAGAGGAWAVMTFGGAASPEAAAERLIDSALSLDVLGLAGSLAPSEISVFRESLEHLSSLQPAEGEAPLADSLKNLAEAVEITKAGLAFETEEVVDDVSRVTVTEGTVTIDGDPAAIASIMTATVRSNFVALQEQYGFSGAEADRALDTMAQDAEQQLGDVLPYTIDFADLVDAAEQGDGSIMPSVMTVKESTGWFVSPMLSYFDAAYLQRAHWDPDVRPLPSSLPEPQQFATPEEAAEGLSEAVVDLFRTGDTDTLASALPLVERRAVGLYGETFYGEGGFESNLEESIFTTEETAGKTLVSIDSLVMELGDSTSVTRTALTGSCFEYETTSTTSTYSGYSYNDSGSGCLGDLPVLAELDIDNPTLVAVEENGGWFISPIATVGAAASTASASFVELVETGRLDRLID